MKAEEALIEKIVAAITKDGAAPISAPYQRAEAALSAIRAAGYCVMPEEPSLPMVRAGMDALKPLHTHFRDHYAEDCYRAMVASLTNGGE